MCNIGTHIWKILLGTNYWGDFFKSVTRILKYRSYQNEHRGANLIFYLSEGALIRGGAHLCRGAH